MEWSITIPNLVEPIIDGGGWTPTIHFTQPSTFTGQDFNWGTGLYRNGLLPDGYIASSMGCLPTISRL